MLLPRRAFIQSSTALAALLGLPEFWSFKADEAGGAVKLPEGNAPPALTFPHFPDRLHAFVWRNWTLVPLEKMAEVIGASPAQVRAMGESMGLEAPGAISEEQQRRSYITVIRRNWHLLPYEQLLKLLDWTPEHMAFMLREDDFLFIKLGSHKPKCEQLRYVKPSTETSRRAGGIAKQIGPILREGTAAQSEPLFTFVKDLSAPFPKVPPGTMQPNRKKSEAPRFCYSYFALYGDPLLEPELDPYPDAYLERLAALGVNGVWMQAVLAKLAPLSWIAESELEKTQRNNRLKNLAAMAARAARHGIGIYLYLNEPRAMPASFFEKHPDLKGAPAGDHFSVCTSNPQVQKGLTDAIALIAKNVPNLAGFFTITASENPTNCWSHGRGRECPRCGKRTPAEVIAEVNTLFYNGIQQAKSRASLLAWDWGWRDDWAEGIVQRLPAGAALMSVSEWSIPIKRGGVDSVVGEYSISTVGPGPRATRHWALARKRGMRTLAKIQAGNTWELSAVPHIPAVENVARHAAQLRQAGIDGLMLGWTLGGYPSANLQAACEISGTPEPPDMPLDEQVDQALTKIARERFGENVAPQMVQAWKSFSAAFREFPYHIGTVYNAPLQAGPSNLLWAKPTGYPATMVGFPYDDLNAWRQVYPPEVFVAQLNKVADGFDAAIATLKTQTAQIKSPEFKAAIHLELNAAEAASIHFRSVANQALFVHLRNSLATETNPEPTRRKIRETLESEIALARRLLAIQTRDSRIGFEATNHYFYIPQDLLEKIINCHYLLEHWA